jgi:hypothetical protein
MRYRVGQKLICIAPGSGWYKNINISKLSFWQRLNLLIKGNKVFGPDKNEVVTVGHSPEAKPGYIPLKEYREFGDYEEKWFIPMIDKNIAKAEKEEVLDFSVTKN